MTIILFLIDTSGSMNQRAHYGARETLLDITKETVERFIKVRQRDPAARGDRYMLLTFDEAPYNVKAGWKENHSFFTNELKNLTASGMTTMNIALRNTFDYLNVNRMQTGIDTYGQGRCPYYLEPTMIILITDGGKYSNSTNVQSELTLPTSLCPGSEFTHEAYRWDQRLFSIVLRLTGTYINESNNFTTVPSDKSPLNTLCETTGGRSFAVSSTKEINWSIEFLIARMYSGVMIRFEKVGPDPPNMPHMTNGAEEDKSWHTSRNMMFVRTQKGYCVGHWPIPESFWPDLNSPTLPPRSAHPVIRFMCHNSEPSVIDNLPFDKYELDPSPLTNYILSRKQPNVAWQVFVANSQRNSDLGQPFGYLKASTSLGCVNLFVLPYNYPMLLPLLDDLFKVLQGKPTREWRIQFETYLKGMPLYYTQPLRRALQKMGAVTNLVPESLDAYSNGTVNSIIKKHKSLAKIEFEKITSQMASLKPINIEWSRISTNHLNSPHSRKATSELFCSNPLLRRAFASKTHYECHDFNGFVVRYKDKQNSDTRTNLYRNPFDIPRHELISQVALLRQMFTQKNLSSLSEDEQMFNLPVSQMGNYQEYLKKKTPPLREIEAAPRREHLFGNPFKLDKKMMMIDEADIDLVGGTPNGNSSPRTGSKRSASDSLSGGSKAKRKPGPLPKDFIYTRSPKSSPASSPSHMMFNSQSPTSPTHPLYQPAFSPQGPPTPPQSPSPLPYHQNHYNSMYSNGHKMSFSNGNIGGNYSKQQGANNKYYPNSMNNGNSAVPLPPVNSSQSYTNNDIELISVNHRPPTPVMVNGDPMPHKPGFAKLNPSLINNNGKSAVPPVPYQFANGKIQTSKTPLPIVKNNSYAQQNGFETNSLYSNRRISLSSTDKEKVRHVMNLVRATNDKEHKKLLEYLGAFSGSFLDYLLHEALRDALRLQKKSLVSTLTGHFGARAHRMLQAYQARDANPRSQRVVT